MAAKDVIHAPVRKALEKDDWTITGDPLILRYRDKRVEVDLAAERWILAAERQHDKIAVEVKSFLNASILQDIEEALGQYIVYLSFLKRSEPERKLYLAASDIAYTLFKKSEAIQMLLSDHHVSLIVVNTERQEIVTWIQN